MCLFHNQKEDEEQGLKEAAAQGVREGLKAKGPASPKGGESKMEMVPLARRQRPSSTQKGLAVPPSPHHPEWPVRRQKPRARGGVERD